MVVFSPDANYSECAPETPKVTGKREHWLPESMAETSHTISLTKAEPAFLKERNIYNGENEASSKCPLKQFLMAASMTYVV
ncbi:hypothetical protein TcWFU_002448 [Taenia crassiceps]|uniref:Uncharacterized protein n=1 Tax=Taenia crassiceps TaxID=6207 RepID=A0ABR4QJM2_9CEST